MCKTSSNDSPLIKPTQPEIPATTPRHIREQAVKFAYLTDRVLGQLSRACARLCRHCLHELQQNPEHCDRIPAYHVDLLAQAIRRELDALYRCLRVDTLEVIDRSYRDWIRRPKKQNQPTRMPVLY